MGITGGESSSPLLNHLLIPAGVCSTIWTDLPSPLIEDHSLRLIDNFKNFSGFAAITLYSGDLDSDVRI